MIQKNKTEQLLIVAAVVLTAAVSTVLPDRIKLSALLITGTLIFLIQSLLRDLMILMRKSKAAEAKRAIRCVCLESGIGFIPIIAAAALVSSGNKMMIHMHFWMWPALTALALLTGYVTKDFILDLKRWRIRKESDHVNIIFQWKV